jgi:hypothetical protein
VRWAVHGSNRESAGFFLDAKPDAGEFHILSVIARTLFYSDDRNKSLALSELSFFPSMSNYNRISLLILLVCRLAKLKVK